MYVRIYKIYNKLTGGMSVDSLGMTEASSRTLPDEGVSKPLARLAGTRSLPNTRKTPVSFELRMNYT